MSSPWGRKPFITLPGRQTASFYRSVLKSQESSSLEALKVLVWSSKEAANDAAFVFQRADAIKSRVYVRPMNCKLRNYYS